MAAVLPHTEETGQIPALAAEGAKERFHSRIISYNQLFYILGRPIRPFIPEIEQLLQRDEQSFGQLLQIPERQIPLASLDPAEVGRMEVCPFSEFFLGQPCLDTQIAYPLTKSTQDNVAHGVLWRGSLSSHIMPLQSVRVLKPYLLEYSQVFAG